MHLESAVEHVGAKIDCEGTFSIVVGVQGILEGE
jgi:hypothetical protein